MKRANVFYMTKQRRVKDFTKQMQTIEVEHQRNKLKKIIMQRKNKWRQSMTNKQLRQPNFAYLKKDPQDFSFVHSNASLEPFLNEKRKRLAFLSNRALSSSPNIKVGNPFSQMTNPQQIEDKIVLNKKFLEYDRIIDRDSPIKKIQALGKLNAKSIYYQYPRNRINQMKRTFFQKIVPDKFNFYTINDYNSIKSSVLSHSKTDQEMRSEIQVLSKLRHASSTIETELRDKVDKSLYQSALRKSRSKNRKMVEFEGYQSQINGSNRTKSQASELLMPISFQKNLDSVHT